MSVPPVDPSLAEPRPPDDDPENATARAVVAVVIIVLMFAALLLLLGQDVQTAVIGAGSACLLAGEVAYRILGRAADHLSTVTVVVAVLLFAGLLLWRGHDLKAALAGAAGGGVVAGEVAHRIIKPETRWK